MVPAKCPAYMMMTPVLRMRGDLVDDASLQIAVAYPRDVEGVRSVGVDGLGRGWRIEVIRGPCGGCRAP